MLWEFVYSLQQCLQLFPGQCVTAPGSSTATRENVSSRHFLFPACAHCSSSVCLELCLPSLMGHVKVICANCTIAFCFVDASLCGIECSKSPPDLKKIKELSWNITSDNPFKQTVAKPFCGKAYK